MELTLKGTPKELTDFVAATQGQPWGADEFTAQFVEDLNQAIAHKAGRVQEK